MGSPTTIHPFPELRALAERRFWPKVEQSGPTMPGMDSECWTWVGALRTSGSGQYGMFWWCGRAIPAARMSLMIAGVDVPDGHFACHRCDNPMCVRPDHLFPGTAKDNAQDMVKKGRWRGPADPAASVRRHFGDDHWTRQRPWDVPRGADSPASRHPERYRGEMNGRAKLTREMVREIRAERARGVGTRSLSVRNGVSMSTIQRIVNGNLWPEESP